MRRRGLAGALALAALALAALAALALAALTALALARPALAESASLRVVRPLDLTALPLLVMQHDHLIERTAEAMGLGAVTVTWTAPGKPGALDTVAAGQADLAMAEPVEFLAAADANAGTAAELRGLAAVAQRPFVLVTRNPAVRTIRDFGPADRIAVPATKLSGPAVMLEMAAAQEWGVEHYDKLDRLAVAQSDAAAAEMLLSGKGEVDAHFSHTPYADAELGDPAIHRVMDSFDIAGPHSIALLVLSSRFHNANPELCKAILSALQEADDSIRKSPGAAVELFADLAKDQDIPLEDLSDMVGDPDLTYSAAPAGIMRIADFLHRIGRLKRRPERWQDLFVPEARDLPGG